MKNLKEVLAVLVVIISLQANSQELFPWTDDITGKEYILPTVRSVYANSENTEGFSITVSVVEDHEEYKVQGFSIKLIATGFACSEDVVFNIVLENGMRLELTSFGDFNCKDKALYLISDLDWAKLKSSPIKATRLTNGYKGAVITAYPDTPEYFQNIEKELIRLTNQK